MSTGGDLITHVGSVGRMRTQTRYWTRQPQWMPEMIFQRRTILITRRSTCRIQLGTWLPRVVVQILAWRRDIVIAQVSPHHTQHSRHMGILLMTIRRLTFPLRAHVFLTSHHFTYTTTHLQHPARLLR